MNGPAACLYRVTFGFRNEGDDRPALPTGACCSVTVVARDGETAITRAREGLREEEEGVDAAKLVSVELIEGVDLPHERERRYRRPGPRLRSQRRALLR
jgi:hypothetical protein